MLCIHSNCKSAKQLLFQIELKFIYEKAGEGNLNNVDNLYILVCESHWTRPRGVLLSTYFIEKRLKRVKVQEKYVLRERITEKKKLITRFSADK